MNKVQVLISTYNGEKYLDEQIQSLIGQKNVHLSILVRDDGSTDDTVSILDKYQKKGVLDWYSGINLKPARSFMDLVKNAPKADFYAFCDQDDVWDSNKLNAAIKKLENFDEKEPSLYFSNTRLVDSNIVPLDTKLKVKPKITLGSALLINPVTGCTEVFNHTLLEIMKKYDNDSIYMHDGWSYRLCMAIGGNAIFDENSFISYRQHENNVVGGTSSVYKKFKRRIKNVITERNRIRETDAKELIKGYSELIPVENLRKIEKVAFYRDSPIIKLQLLFDKELKTNSLEHNFAFICAVLLDAL